MKRAVLCVVLVGCASAQQASAPGASDRFVSKLTNPPSPGKNAESAIRKQANDFPPASSARPSAPLPPAHPRSVTILAGGDIELGRAMGQRLLKDPAYDPFPTLAPLLASADVRFANLEGPLSDQHGETMRPDNMLVFTGPPAGADALAHAGFTILSTANNHAWDYGKAALFETLDHLDRVGVAHVGTGRTRDDAYRPTIVERNAVRIAFLAVTDIWNQGPLEVHEGAGYVARADERAIAESVAAAKKAADIVLVSYHGGDEYMDRPRARTRAILHAAIDAGADAVLGHHPHVMQGIEWHAGRPILYSMGNLLMQMHRDHPWTGYGYMARLRVTPGDAPALEACPYRIVGYTPMPFAGDEHRAVFESVFFAHLRDVNAQAAVKPATVGKPGDDGCAPVTP